MLQPILHRWLFLAIEKEVIYILSFHAKNYYKYFQEMKFMYPVESCLYTSSEVLLCWRTLILKLVLLVSVWSLAHFNAGDSHSTPRRGGFAIKEAMAKLIATVVQYTCLCPHVTGFSWSTNDLPLVINMATMHHPMHI